MKINTLCGTFDHSLPTLVCVHSSASSGRQWQSLAERARGYFNVVAHDLLGYGNAPAASSRLTMDDQVAHLLQLVRAIPGPIHLVGHSYGGAVSTHFALRHGCMLSSLSVYESVSVDLLFDELAPRHLLTEIMNVGNSVIRDVRNGRLEVAAARFIDYWNGEGTWFQLPTATRNRMAMRIPTVAWEFQSIISEPTSEASYTRQHLPVQVLYGSETRRTASWMSKRLGNLFPRAETRELDDLDHMAPVTCPDQVNPLILQFADASLGVQHRARWAA